MKINTLALVLLLNLTLLSSGNAQVPQLLDYQGGVALGGTAFHGLGYFKFAFVSRDGVQTFWSNDGTGIGAAPPQKSLPLVVYRGSYEVMLGDTTLTNMLPVPPTVFTNADVHLRVWFSDDNVSFQQVEPDTPITSVGYAMVAATVPDGAITSGKLANGAVTAGKLGANAVTGMNVAPGAISAKQLAPNAAALNLSGSGGLVLSEQANASNLVQAGFSKIGTVLADADQWTAFGSYTPAPRTNGIAAWIGDQFLICGGRDGSRTYTDGACYNPGTETWTPIGSILPVTPANLLARGIWTGQELLLLANYENQHRRYNPTTDTWRPISRTNAAVVTDAMTVVLWTGTEVLVWSSGRGGSRYDPAHDLWKPMAKTNLLISIANYAGAWTGTEMMLWGTLSAGGGIGARYNPATDTWRLVSRTNAPVGRYYHTAVCTGPEVIIWGGQSASPIVSNAPRLNSGGIYNLATDTWRSMSANNVVARSQHVACWTGTEMLVWGGSGIVTQLGGSTRVVRLDGGARYNPKTDTWQPLATNGLPATLPNAVTAWSGTELYVWGGGGFVDGSSVIRPISNAGWRYRPANDSWRPIAGVPVGRTGHTAVWTGSELIVWGGNLNGTGASSALTLLNSGARFSPATGRWYPIASANAPEARWNHRAVWTGREMIVWGGEGVLSNSYYTTLLNTGGCYDPATDTWRAMDTDGAPIPRAAHSMVWTGSELLIFGGRTTTSADATGRNAVSSGARYQPQTDSWATLSSKQAPSPRHSHVGVWTGTEMIVWGGVGPITNNVYRALATGARYNPVLNAWSPMAGGLAAPTGIVTGVWADHAMIVWSGTSAMGGSYDPSSDRWESIAVGGPRSSASSPNAVWTGNEMLVWGGLGSTVGSRYRPITDTWTAMTTSGAPKFSLVPPGAWTGSGLLLAGGTGTSALTNATYYYTLTKPLYLYRHP